jgi:hypothetical protein
MSIVTTGVAHIINTIEDLLFLTESQHSLNISTGSDEKDNIFIKIDFCLKNGKSEIKIYNNGGCFSYFDFSGENLESIYFNESNLTDTGGAFHKALKALIIFDRQNATQEVKTANTLIDRASFGLAEVN